MFTYRDDSGDEEVQLLASPRSCYACERGVRFPELNQQGVSILDRPRSALSPGTVKRAEIWTPEKAKEVSKELVLARESRTPKRRPFSASVSVATRNRMKPGGASLADSPSCLSNTVQNQRSLVHPCCHCTVQGTGGCPRSCPLLPCQRANVAKRS